MTEENENNLKILNNQLTQKVHECYIHYNILLEHKNRTRFTRNQDVQTSPNHSLTRFNVGLPFDCPPKKSSEGT